MRKPGCRPSADVITAPWGQVEESSPEQFLPLQELCVPSHKGKIKCLGWSLAFSHDPNLTACA